MRSIYFMMVLVLFLSVASVASSAHALSVSVWTDKYTYQVGETVVIYISVSAGCTAQYTIIMPDGSRNVYGPWNLAAGQYYDAGIASYPIGRRTVLLEAWAGNEYVTATTYYEVIPPPYTVTIRIEGLPSTYSTTVYVDGVAKGKIAGGRSKSFRFKAGTSHTILVNQSIDAGQGKRYYCQFNSQSFSSDSSHTFGYVAQYLLTINSAHGGTVGQGWCDSGSSARFSVTSPVSGGTGIQYVFTGWSGDYEGKEVAASITMDSPHTITANWKTQYYLTVVSDHGNPQGEGWYDAAESTQARVSNETVSENEAIRHIFTGWSGGASGVNVQSNKIYMDGPKTAIANWKTQYYLTVVSEHGNPQGADWYDAGSTATFSVTSPIGVGVQYVLDHWNGDSTANTPTASILMDGPKTVRAVWRLDYTQIIIVASLVGCATVALGFRSMKKRRLAPKLLKPPAPVRLEVAPKEDEIRKLKEEIERYNGLAQRLEELRQKGEIQEALYEKLKLEYQTKMKKLEQELEGL